MKLACAFGLRDVPVDLPGVLDGQQILGGDAFHLATCDFKWMINLRNCDFAGEFGMAVAKRLHLLGISGFTNRIGHVNREEIRIRNEAVHGFEPDVVGVHVVWFLPAERSDCGLGGGTGAGGFGTDEAVLAVGFIPDRNNFNALLGKFDAGLQLSLCLMSKPVSNSKRILPEFQEFCHKTTF